VESPRPPRPSRVAWAALAVGLALVSAGCGEVGGPRAETFAPSRAGEPSTVPTSQSGVGEGAGQASPGPGTSVEDASPAPYVPADSIDAVAKRLAVVLGDRTIYIRNSGKVVLGDGLVAEIYLDPYPPSVLRSTIDVYVTRDGQAITDGGVEVRYDMLSMGHGPFSVEARKIGGGHYLISLDYIMFGPWEQVITIRIGLERIELPIIVVAYP
jgi:hypothetical protein